MANFGGGIIFIGVAEPTKGHFKSVGVSDSSLESLETTTLNKSLRSFMDPSVFVEVERWTHKKKTYVILRIPSADSSPIFAKIDNPKAPLYQGRIYVRNSAAESREITNHVELKRLLDRLSGK
jgi:predicted HTH transcriptional regulator